MSTENSKIKDDDDEPLDLKDAFIEKIVLALCFATCFGVFIKIIFF
ncbi:MAG: hypothetical protein V4543_17835 [Bacteroidota bacterium]